MRSTLSFALGRCVPHRRFIMAGPWSPAQCQISVQSRKSNGLIAGVSLKGVMAAPCAAASPRSGLPGRRADALANDGGYLSQDFAGNLQRRAGGVHLQGALRVKPEWRLDSVKHSAVGTCRKASSSSPGPPFPAQRPHAQSETAPPLSAPQTRHILSPRRWPTPPAPALPRTLTVASP